jgi:hypothetical protein
MNPTPYNPFRAAAVAAFTELSSEQAHRYYTLKAQKDFQNTLDSTITLVCWVYQLAEMTYMMGLQCRIMYNSLESQTQAPILSSMALAPAKNEIALLPPAIPSIIQELKSARTALALAQESDRLAVAALGYVVDQAVEFMSEKTCLKVNLPDYWLEPLPVSHTPCHAGPIWNPSVVQNIHEEVQRLWILQHVPFTLPPAKEPLPSDPVTVLDVPGAIAKPKRSRKPKPKAQQENVGAKRPTNSSTTPKSKRKTMTK